MNYREKLDKWTKASEQEAAIAFPTKSEMSDIFDYAQALFTFAKFKEGDLIEMVETYDVSLEESPGWYSIRHLLKKGTKAKVMNVDWYKGRFSYLIEFEEGDTWIDDKEVVHKKKFDNHYTNIMISERWLAPRATEKAPTKKSLLRKIKDK